MERSVTTQRTCQHFEVHLRLIQLAHAAQRLGHHQTQRQRDLHGTEDQGHPE